MKTEEPAGREPEKQAPGQPEYEEEPCGLCGLLAAARSDLKWIWSGKTTLLEKVLPTVPTVLKWFLSGSSAEVFLKPDSWLRRNFTDLYATALAMILSVVLFRWWWQPPQYVARYLAIYRAFDILNYRLYFLLVKGHRKRPWQPEKLKRSLAFALVNFYEVVAAYAILYLISGDVCRGEETLSSPVAAFYFSLVTMATLGYGDYVPRGDTTQRIVVAQIATSLLFLAFIVPALVSVFSGGQGEDGKERGHKTNQP